MASVGFRCCSIHTSPERPQGLDLAVAFAQRAVKRKGVFAAEPKFFQPPGRFQVDWSLDQMICEPTRALPDPARGCLGCCWWRPLSRYDRFLLRRRNRIDGRTTAPNGWYQSSMASLAALHETAPYGLAYGQDAVDTEKTPDPRVWS